MLAANREAKKVGALLDDDSDTFLKNDCRAGDKWVLLELSQVAKVARLELAQFELYSARVREWQALGRQSHPRTDGFGSEYARTLDSSQWRLLGNFTGGGREGWSDGGCCACAVPAVCAPLPGTAISMASARQLLHASSPTASTLLQPRRPRAARCLSWSSRAGCATSCCASSRSTAPSRCAPSTPSRCWERALWRSWRISWRWRRGWITCREGMALRKGWSRSSRQRQQPHQQQSLVRQRAGLQQPSHQRMPPVQGRRQQPQLGRQQCLEQALGRRQRQRRRSSSKSSSSLFSSRSQLQSRLSNSQSLLRAAQQPVQAPCQTQQVRQRLNLQCQQKGQRTQAAALLSQACKNLRWWRMQLLTAVVLAATAATQATGLLAVVLMTQPASSLLPRA